MHSVGETYVRAIHRVGGTPVIIPPLMKDGDWSVLLERLDGLLLSGGGDIAPLQYGQAREDWVAGVDEERDYSELGLIQRWLGTGRPVLAICRGHQLLNVALGGVLCQDIAAYFPQALDHSYIPARPLEKVVHSVILEPDSRLAQILGGSHFDVNSAHHQAIKISGEGLSKVGYAPDGVVEAVELSGHHFCVSVQWHPEAMVKSSDTMWPLFEAFVQHA